MLRLDIDLVLEPGCLLLQPFFFLRSCFRLTTYPESGVGEQQKIGVSIIGALIGGRHQVHQNRNIVVIIDYHFHVPFLSPIPDAC